MPQNDVENRYSLMVGLVFIFNIIVGTGALTLPAAFAKAGWALGSISIIFLAFVSYINATYVIECMACANAVLKWKRSDFTSDSAVLIQDAVETDESIDENTPMNRAEGNRNLANVGEGHILSVSTSHYYSLDTRVELGEMATLFFNSLGKIAFYITIIVYLFGDLSIYSAAIAKSTMDVICAHGSDNNTNISLTDDRPCFNSTNEEAEAFTRLECYRIVLIVFLAMLGPFVFFNVQKTKYLQIITSLMRWLAFGIMISLAVLFLIKNGPEGSPPVFDMGGVPALFGSCIYSFMCHHSLPGMVAPITSKKRLWPSLLFDFIIIGFFYLLLALTGIFAFKELEDLYTLNFIPSIGAEGGNFLKVIGYFLALFPVFTLSTSFPVVAITLRNNIQHMFLDMAKINTYNICLRRLLFPLITIIPPIILTMFVEDITILVSFTGSFAGAGIQYLIPTFLVLAARKECRKIFSSTTKNPYESPFKHGFWAIFILAWSIICVIMVALNMIKKNAS